MPLLSVNPADGREIASYPEMDPAAETAAIAAAHAAYQEWRRSDFSHRARLMSALAAALRARAEGLAGLMTAEMGKPVRDGRAEVEKCAVGCEHFARHAQAYLTPEPVATEARTSYVAFNPLGIVLAVMPWNFPLWQVVRFAAPALMAGNAALLKHAPNVQGCAAAIESLFAEAGFPTGLFRNLPVQANRVDGILADPRVRAVTLTGSTGAGRAVAARAGALLKKSVLELGGSDAYLILEDADVEAAARICAQARLVNAGQSCIAAKRFVVVEPVRRRFEEALAAELAAVTPGDPRDAATVMGPLARVDLRDALHAQVEASLAKGARLILGGRVPPGPGAWYPPTLLTDVRPGMPACDDELFGPVAAVIPVADEEAAIRAANDSRFGLGAAVFTRNTARGERIAAESLEAGCCFVNAQVKSDPRLPFGGIKESGYGRELSAYGIREFVNIKTVYAA